MAKILRRERSQAVRLPRGFRFDGGTVRIRRHGNAVIVELVAEDRSWLDAIAQPLPGKGEPRAVHRR